MQIIGTGKQRAAKTSRILVGAQALAYASYEATLQGEDFPTVNFESFNVPLQQTFDEGVLGALTSDVRFGGDWDAGANPLGSPPGLYPRDDLTGLQFFTSRLDGVAWSYPYVRIRSASNGGEVRGKVTFQTAGRNQGPFVWPTGSV